MNIQQYAYLTVNYFDLALHIHIVGALLNRAHIVHNYQWIPCLLWNFRAMWIFWTSKWMQYGNTFPFMERTLINSNPTFITTKACSTWFMEQLNKKDNFFVNWMSKMAKNEDFIMVFKLVTRQLICITFMNFKHVPSCVCRLPFVKNKSLRTRFSCQILFSPS